MKRFIISVGLFFLVPLILLLFLYVVTDPYRIVQPFDKNNIDETNREYYSTELFLQNNPSQKYDSFIFCSSRGGGISSYLWKHLLGDTIRPFVFQAWNENLIGIEEKVKFVDGQGNDIKYALILLDFPGSFRNGKKSDPVDHHHYLLDGGTKLSYNFFFYKNFVQKPSEWLVAIKKSNKILSNEYDTISNDRFNTNIDTWDSMPPMDSLKYCSPMGRKTFLNKVKCQKEDDIVVAAPCIKEDDKKRLRRIKSVFDKHNTQVKILIDPYYIYQNPIASPDDVKILKDIFGESNVYDFTQKSDITTNYNYYSDPSHFGLRAGRVMLLKIYGNQCF